MKLSEKQSEFTRCIGLLIVYATKQGYSLTFGDAYATRGHIPNSNHYRRLAVDFNLFVDGEYIRTSQHRAWSDLHEHWETLSPMASPMIISDANHFSFTHKGVW